MRLRDKLELSNNYIMLDGLIKYREILIDKMSYLDRHINYNVLNEDEWYDADTMREELEIQIIEYDLYIERLTAKRDALYAKLERAQKESMNVKQAIA